ncbi:hypothetical protein ACSCB1_00190 [Streptomyces europaeiscabiei]|uniref:hypothetical protein n=1 Tax=Streptomyces europaeiscabiei TaxID=146819 RepID=UPI00131B0294|nr:hypothetical protein [Streptomyces europaeiscabiei]
MVGMLTDDVRSLVTARPWPVTLVRPDPAVAVYAAGRWRDLHAYTAAAPTSPLPTSP